LYLGLLVCGFSAGQVPSEPAPASQLAAVLDTIYKDDQTHRLQLREIESAFGRNSDEMAAQWSLIRKKDSINSLKVQKILDEHGWLGPDAVGTQGNATLFLVIQHAALEIQEKYLPAMRDAVQKGNAKASNLALLEDRVAIRNGQRQMYGSQVGRDQETGEYFVLPLTDPDNVDTRRAEVGLGPMKEYVANWGLIWDAVEYKRKLPEIEAKHKE
jgi:hypothetical protein